jgi:tetratricopeptide (TPR) repeat protein
MLRSAWRWWEAWVAARAHKNADVRTVAIAYAGLTASLTLAALGLGAQHISVLLLVVATVATTAVLVLRESTSTLPPVAKLFFALGAWTLLQACPLPLPALRAVAPKNAEIWTHAYEITGRARTWASLSLDPGASVVEALKWTTYGAAAIAASLVAAQLGLRMIAALAFLLPLLVGSVTLAHGLLHAHTLYGFYVPSFDPGPWGLGPLLNPNNRAGFLNLGAFSGLSLLVSRSHRGPRWPVTLGVGGLIAVSVLARSRGGLLALVVAGLWLALMLLRKGMIRDGRRRAFYLRAAIPPLLALAGGAGLALLGGDGKIWQRMREESLAKLHVVEWTRPMFRDFPLFGVGRGAFETVFPAYRQNGANQIYHHAENFLTDWAVEWGILAALGTFVLLTWLVRARPREEPSRAVLRLSLTALLIQNLVDHALEMPAIALLATTVVAGLAANNAAAPEADRGPSESGRGPLAVSIALAVAALSVGAVLWGRDTAYRDRAALSTRFRGLTPGDEQDARDALDEISAAIVRHPGDAFLPLLGAATARRVPGGKPLRWLGWALERDPLSGRAHLALAYFLEAVGATTQALGELGTAAERDAALRTQAAQWAAAFAREPTDALTVVPEGPGGAPMLLVLAGSPRLRPYRLTLLEEATERDPDLGPARKAAARAYIEAMETPVGSACALARPACLERLNKHILAIARQSPESSLATELTARLLAATGRGDEARALLSSTCSSFTVQATCWQLRISLGNGEVSGPALREALQAYYTGACSNEDTCIRAAIWLGGALEQRGDYTGALEYYGRAVRSGSSTANIWLAIARVARQANQPRRAEEALRRAVRAGASDPESAGQVDQQRLGSVLPPSVAGTGSP